MIHRHFVIFAAITLVLSSTPIARSQSFGGGMGSHGSSMGSSGFGSSAFGSGGMGGGMGTSGFGGMGGGMGSSGFGGMGGGMGSSGFGGMGGGMGTSGFGGNSMMGNSGFGGNSFNGANGGGQNFIGRDPNDMQATFGQMGKAGTQFFNQMNRMNNNNRRQTKKTVQNQAQPMRVEVKVAFDAKRPTPTQFTETVRTRLTKVLAGRKMSSPVVNMEGDTAVITGVAASENDRDVISALLALEPGIRDVRNEMTVGQPASAGIVPTPGS